MSADVHIRVRPRDSRAMEDRPYSPVAAGLRRPESVRPLDDVGEVRRRWRHRNLRGSPGRPRGHVGSGPYSLEDQPRRILEDAVVGHQRDAEAQCGGGDPAVGVVFALAQGMADTLTGNAELDVGPDEVVAGVDYLGAGDLSLESTQASAAPTAPNGTEAKLGDCLE